MPSLFKQSGTGITYSRILFSPPVKRNPHGKSLFCFPPTFFLFIFQEVNNLHNLQNCWMTDGTKGCPFYGMHALVPVSTQNIITTPALFPSLPLFSVFYSFTWHSVALSFQELLEDSEAMLWVSFVLWKTCFKAYFRMHKKILFLWVASFAALLSFWTWSSVLWGVAVVPIVLLVDFQWHYLL